MSCLAGIALLLGAVLWVSAVLAEVITEQTSVSLGTGLSVLGVSFGAWAFVLGWVMFVVRREFGELRKFVEEESKRRRDADERAHQDRLQLERRLTEIETYWRSQNHHGRN
jgi:type VI protein secretion system component VasK